MSTLVLTDIINEYKYNDIAQMVEIFHLIAMMQFLQEHRV